MLVVVVYKCNLFNTNNVFGFVISNLKAKRKEENI